MEGPLDRLDAMSVLIAAVEGGSLSRASRNLRLPLATVSRKVAELEAHLNASLLIRSAKGLELTLAGRSYVTAAKAILEQLTEAERAAASEYTKPKGRSGDTAQRGRRDAKPARHGLEVLVPQQLQHRSRLALAGHPHSAARPVLRSSCTSSGGDRPLARCLRQP